MSETMSKEAKYKAALVRRIKEGHPRGPYWIKKIMGLDAAWEAREQVIEPATAEGAMRIGASTIPVPTTDDPAETELDRLQSAISMILELYDGMELLSVTRIDNLSQRQVPTVDIQLRFAEVPR